MSGQGQRSMRFVTQDYYEILNVKPGAGQEDVKRAYRLVRQSFRPDSMAVHSLYSPEETEAICAKIDEAFRILGSADGSARYAKYHRSGRAGLPIPRDPVQFFERAHELDEPLGLMALARQLGRPVDDGGDGEPRSLEQAELGGPRTATRPGLPSVTVRARTTTGSIGIPGAVTGPAPAVAPRASVAAAAAPPPPAPSPAPLQAALVEPRAALAQVEMFIEQLEELLPDEAPATEPAALGPVAAPPARVPAAASAAAVDVPPARRWMRETITTRAVGPLQVRALPPEELDAIEADCGGIGGAFLQQVRREMGINLEDIAERTKIGSHWLRAIETEDRDSLPARVYLKGYLQQISRLLQLPPRVCDGYLERLAAAPAEARRA